MNKHFTNIDVLKGICIVIVIIEHAHWPSNIYYNFLFPIWDRFAIPCFMVISGYVYSHSFSKNESIKEHYSNKLIPRLLRYLIPYTTAIIIEFLAIYIITKFDLLNLLNISIKSNLNEQLSFTSILKTYFTGGYGPGNYYTPVIMELTILFPYINKFIKKYRFKGLILAFIFCLCSELWQYYFHIPNEIYRLLVFRHMFTICFGIYVYLGYWKQNKLLNVLSLLTGLTYILAHSYLGFTPYFFNRGWADVCFVSCLFYAPIAGFLIKKEDIKFKPLEKIGKASYHIYLTQMVYYYFVKYEYVSLIIPNKLVFALLSIIICTFCGYIFYSINIKMNIGKH